MTDALVDNMTDYLVSENSKDISPGHHDSFDTEEEEYHHKHQSLSNTPVSKVTALTLPEPLKATEELLASLNNNSSISKFNNTTGIIYRDYISESSDLNSDSSSPSYEAQQQQQQEQSFRQSTGDLTIISKAVSVDTHNSESVSAVVPAERNPVSDLLRSPASDHSVDDGSDLEEGLNDVTISEYYYSSDQNKLDPEELALSANATTPTAIVKSIPFKMLAIDPQGLSTKVIPERDPYGVHERDGGSQQVLPLPLFMQSNHINGEGNENDDDDDIMIKPRFITMEEELSATDSLSEDSEEHDEMALNNLSMVDLTLRVKSGEEEGMEEENEIKKPEIRSLEQRRSIKRLNAIKELMETEETYSRDLGILCTHFFAIIKDSACITTNEIDILVRNAMDILTFQEKFTEVLIEAHGDEETEKNGIFYKGSLKNIANCFVEWGPKFEIYLDYCVRHDHAQTVYNELLQTNVEFANLIERLHTFHRVSFGFSRLKFDDYLIIPFQRIFRYRLLLQSITKATQKDTEEYDILSKAQNTIHVIATRINNEKSIMEAKRKTALFLSRLDSDWCLPKRWFSTLGVCTLIGTLEVRSIEDNKAKRIGCALFSHYMIMAKAKKHNQYEPRYWFPLRKFEVENMPNNEVSMNYSWLLRSEENTLELSAICELEKQIWMEALSKAVKESKDLYSSSIESSEYLLEQLFVSSFDQNVPKQQQTTIVAGRNGDTPTDTSIPVHFPMPNGSTSFSQSAIFNKPSKLSNRSSHPVFNTQEFPMTNVAATASKQSHHSGIRSPGLRSQSSISDLREFFSANLVTEKWSQRKYNQFHTRCKSVDTKFDDVCTTPILTARANSMHRNGSFSHARKNQAVSSLLKPPTDRLSVASFSSSPSMLDGRSPLSTFSSNSSSRRPSITNTTDSMIFRLAQRRSSLNRSNSINYQPATATVPNKNNTLLSTMNEQHGGGSNNHSASMGFSGGMLSSSSLVSENGSTSGLGTRTRPSKFFGKMVEKLGQIGTPKLRRKGSGNSAPSVTMNSSSASLASYSQKPPMLSSGLGRQQHFESSSTPLSTKKKFFPHFLHSKHVRKQ